MTLSPLLIKRYPFRFYVERYFPDEADEAAKREQYGWLLAGLVTLALTVLFQWRGWRSDDLPTVFLCAVTALNLPLSLWSDWKHRAVPGEVLNLLFGLGFFSYAACYLVTGKLPFVTFLFVIEAFIFACNLLTGDYLWGQSDWRAYRLAVLPAFWNVNYLAVYSVVLIVTCVCTWLYLKRGNKGKVTLPAVPIIEFSVLVSVFLLGCS